MKRLLINTIMLFSSFFFFSNVEAAIIEPEIDFTLLNDNFYKIKEAAENFVKEDTSYSDDFLIYYSYGYYVYFLKLNYTYIPNCTVYDSSNYRLRCFLASSGSIDRFFYSSTSNSFFKSGTEAYNQNYIVYKKTSSSLDFVFLYSTFDIDFKKYNGSISVVYNYNDFSTTITDSGTDKIKTLYQLNYEYNTFIGNKELVHQEESNKIKSFYNLCIEKIVYLATIFADSYIYLSIFVIFILIFIFSLIKRRYF